jgi:hypothetical protein
MCFANFASFEKRFTDIMSLLNNKIKGWIRHSTRRTRWANEIPWKCPEFRADLRSGRLTTAARQFTFLFRHVILQTLL